MIEKDGAGGTGDSRLEVGGILENDVGRFAAQLERARDQVPPAGLAHLAPRRDAAGEGDLVDPALDERRARLAVADGHRDFAVETFGAAESHEFTYRTGL